LLVGWLGARLYGRDAGVIAAALLSGSLMYFALSHWNTLDMGLTFFLTVGIGAFLVAQQSPVGSTAERSYMLLAWAAAALALLSKGIVALALPVMALIAYTVIEREFSAWRRLHLVQGLLLFAVIGAPWLIAVSIANPGFATFFFLHEHFARFLTDVHQRVEPWWYFLPFVIVGALPWTSLAAVATLKAWRSDTGGDQPTFRTRRFLIIWAAVIVLFFSASHSKLAPYIVPIFPALALLTGDYIARSVPSAIRKHLIGIGVFWAVVLAYLGYALVANRLPHRSGIAPEAFAAVFRWMSAGAAVALASAVIGWMLVGRSQIRAAIIILSTGSFLLFSILIVQFDAARTIRSGYDLAQIVKPHLKPNLPLYSILTYDHSLAFYLNRNATVVNYQGELEFGQGQEPGKSLATWQEFAQIWQHDPAGSVAVMKHEAYEALTHANVPMQVIGSNLQLIAVKKP
jgi:4-amino-4-deoxy-L-arabinose transferase-like glycosyltransferase